MIGDMLFGCPPIGTEAKVPTRTLGWNKQCKKESKWSKVPKNTAETRGCGYRQTCVR